MAIEFDQIKIGIVTLTVGNWHLMKPHCDSIYKHYRHPKEFYIIPNIDYGMSLSAALNKGVKRALTDGCDFVVYIADDVTVGQDSIQTLLRQFEEDVWIVHGTGRNTGGWDMFATHPEIFTRVGFFDEEFYPAYFEDNDYARRISLVDDTKYRYVPAKFKHLGSQTIGQFTEKQLEKHHHDFEANRDRYVAKWGGIPGEETYTVPYNKSVWPKPEDWAKFPGI